MEGHQAHATMIERADAFAANVLPVMNRSVCPALSLIRPLALR